MSELASKTELLRRLGKLVRGLAALFWGLPLALLVYVITGSSDFFYALGFFAVVPPFLASALLLYGLAQLGHFQKQERIWVDTLDRAKLFGLVNLGLSPFLFWWHRFPYEKVYQAALLLLAASSLIFIFILNRVLDRLAAMLPDETLRLETRLFTSFNRRVLLTIPILIVVYFALEFFPPLPYLLQSIIVHLQPQSLWIILFLVLMPLAMTMALIWKIKEVVFSSILETDR
ncbi:MAG: hypothetical protein ABJC04_07020 [Verrucomicrobiota bacterium]